MTRLETRLAEYLYKEFRELTSEQTIESLISRGLLDRKVCEAQAIRAETERLVRQGMPRCEAMHVTAGLFCCSYGKVRGIVYDR